MSDFYVLLIQFILFLFVLFILSIFVLVIFNLFNSIFMFRKRQKIAKKYYLEDIY